jgi:hypothetical protein
MRSASFFFLSLISLHGLSQTFGCRDPLAFNFQASATLPDGSCQYASTSVQPAVKFTNLPANLRETSGLLLIGPYLYSVNDAGNFNLIQKIDTSSGQVVVQIPVLGMSNNDWEALTMDNEYVYIGDFGNNKGNRTNLRVIKIATSLLVAAGASGVQGEVINFSYMDQGSFDVSTSHNFDCEAFVAQGDSLHLFTKNRSNFFTKHYKLSKNPGQHRAYLKDSLFVGGQVTDAALHPNRNELAFVGYVPNSVSVFSYLLFGYEGDSFFSTNKRRLELPNVAISGQTEGICYTPSGKWFISNEYINAAIPAKISSFNPGAFVNSYFLLSDAKPKKISSQNIKIFQKQGKIEIESESELRRTRLLDVAGKSIFEIPLQGRSGEFFYPGNFSGIFLLEVSNLHGVSHQRICLF